MRRRVALILQAVAGAFGFYGLGRLVVGQWARGLVELLGLGLLVIVALPMLGVNLLVAPFGMGCTFRALSK